MANEEHKHLNVFVSHAKEDSEFARRITRFLQQKKVRVWLAEQQLAIGDSVIEAIDTAIRTTDVLIAILSRASRGAKWFKYEIERSQRDHDIEIIFVSVDGTELPTDLRKLRCIRGMDEESFPYDEIVDLLQQRFPNAAEYDRRSNLIPEVPEMIGRDDAILRLEELSKKHNSIAITGMAGIGKTTLAAAFARWAQKTKLVDRVVWVNGSQANEAGFIDELARSFGVPETGVDLNVAMQYIVRTIETESTSTLIVIDDASEATLDIIQRLVRDPIRSNVRVLFTSRARQFSGAQRDTVVFDLDNLTATKALSFLNISLRKDVAISDEQAREIVAQTGGLPLALQIIAGQLNLGIDPDSIIETLRAGTVGPKIGSLKSTLDRTYDSLTADDRRVLESIAHFEDTLVTIRTVSTLAGMANTSRVSESVTRLAAVGMVRLEDDRVSMHDLVCDYVKQQPKAVEPAQTLYITVDPALMAKEDLVEVLETLNAIYSQLGGDELIIREDEIGHFATAGVLV